MNGLQEIKTVGDALAIGGMVALQGMAIVFLSLILLMIILVLMKVFFYKDPSKQKSKVSEVAIASPVAPQEAEDEVDEGEFIAVLTAAIAASLNTSTYNLKIKSYRRVGSNAPAWNRAGLEETVNHY